MIFVLNPVRVHNATDGTGKLNVTSLHPEHIRARSLAPICLHSGTSVSQLSKESISIWGCTCIPVLTRGESRKGRDAVLVGDANGARVLKMQGTVNGEGETSMAV